MKVSIEVADKKIRELILDYVRSKLGAEAHVKLDDIKVLVKSKNNYRTQEWEQGTLNVKYEGEV